MAIEKTLENKINSQSHSTKLKTDYKGYFLDLLQECTEQYGI